MRALVMVTLDTQALPVVADMRTLVMVMLDTQALPVVANTRALLMGRGFRTRPVALRVCWVTGVAPGLVMPVVG
ncbi:hypothetical protein ACGF0J_01455 [Nonomuraea sp. NPDC047897]|uniref:hypothetical protein n=1 Tax=Nonomuraea sp. NPDC047897 TaxID=3364346 RepID=UPI003713EC9B